jgi:predicted alpha-1,6-mannanase (GH76 family)
MAVPASALSAAARDDWAAATLLRYFTPRTGRWSFPTGDAWQPALAIEAMTNTYQRTHDVSYRNVIEKSFGRYRGRRSRFYDDDGWYLNAWVRAYDVTGEDRYLHEARALFTVMTEAWDETCGGGVWWSVERSYKNAITNELFLLAAARLHRRTGEPDYRGWAERAWAWFDASRLINPVNLVNDGLNGACVNNGDTTWTYNQGVILSALVELWRISGDRDQLRRAQSIAAATIETLVHADGVLREPSEPHLGKKGGNKDAHLFKGIFAQGLARLYDADRSSRPQFGAFLAANADAVWYAGRHPRRGVGMAWHGPAEWVTAATHTSAALLFSELALLEIDPADRPVTW